MKMKKFLISVLIAVLSTVSLAGQERWKIEDFKELAAKLQWDSSGNGILWHGEYRSITYTSLDDVYVESVNLVKEHETVIKAKKDFRHLMDYFRRQEMEEWKIDRNKYFIYLRDYGVYIGREGKMVSVEFSRYTGKE